MSRPVNVYEYYIYNTYQRTGTVKELSKFLSKTPKTIHRMPRLKPGEKLDPEIGKHHLVHVDTIKPEGSTYAFYDGEELLADGTLTEIAETLGKDPEVIRWYKTPSARKRNLRKVLVRLDDDEEALYG